MTAAQRSHNITTNGYLQAKLMVDHGCCKSEIYSATVQRNRRAEGEIFCWYCPHWSVLTVVENVTTQ